MASHSDFNTQAKGEGFKGDFDIAHKDLQAQKYRTTMGNHPLIYYSDESQQKDMEQQRLTWNLGEQ